MPGQPFSLYNIFGGQHFFIFTFRVLDKINAGWLEETNVKYKYWNYYFLNFGSSLKAPGSWKAEIIFTCCQCCGYSYNCDWHNKMGLT